MPSSIDRRGRHQTVDYMAGGEDERTRAAEPQELMTTPATAVMTDQSRGTGAHPQPAHISLPRVAHSLPDRHPPSRPHPPLLLQQTSERHNIRGGALTPSSPYQVGTLRRMSATSARSITPWAGRDTTRTAAGWPAPIVRAASNAASASRTARRASAVSAIPAGVSRTSRVVRANSGTPRSRSRSRMILETVCWRTWRITAARVKLS